MDKVITNPKLKTWNNLNKALMEADEKTCQQLLKEEIGGRNRQTFKKRIHSRINRLRADRERKEILNS